MEKEFLYLPQLSSNRNSLLIPRKLSPIGRFSSLFAWPFFPGNEQPGKVHNGNNSVSYAGGAVPSLVQTGSDKLKEG